MTVYDNIAFGLSNVKDTLPKVDFEAKNAARLAQILKHPGEVVKVLEDCRDKNGKLDEKKAQLKLVDAFTISIYTAKQLFAYHLESGKDPDLPGHRRAQRARWPPPRRTPHAAGAGRAVPAGAERPARGHGDPEADQGGDRPDCAPGLPHREDRHVHGPLSRRALRRPAAAGGHRPHPGPGALRAVHG